MSDQRNTDSPRSDRDPSLNRTENRSSIPNDLPDSPADRAKLEGEETTIDLPDVKDIPGQEFVNAAPAGILRGSTASSSDEEGRGIFEHGEGNEFDVTAEDRAVLEDTEYMPTTDEDNLRRASLDNTDFSGEALNEKGFGEEISGADLDVPEEEETTDSDLDGQGDEENKYYSLGSSDNDNVTEGTP